MGQKFASGKTFLGPVGDDEKVVRKEGKQPVLSGHPDMVNEVRGGIRL